METALEEYELEHASGVAVRPWPKLAAAVQHLQDLQHAHSNYAGQGELDPMLLGELHETYVNRVRRSRRHAGGRELRGLAFRMSIAPT